MFTSMYVCIICTCIHMHIYIYIYLWRGPPKPARGRRSARASPGCLCVCSRFLGRAARTQRPRSPCRAYPCTVALAEGVLFGCFSSAYLRICLDSAGLLMSWKGSQRPVRVGAVAAESVFEEPAASGSLAGGRGEIVRSLRRGARADGETTKALYAGQHS